MILTFPSRCEKIFESSIYTTIMGMEVNYSVNSDYLNAVTTGEFELGAARDRFIEILDLVEKHKIHKVLFDGRAITGDPLVIERFYYGEFVAESVNGLLLRGWVGATPQFAYVLEEPQLDPYRLGETVAVNRGVNLKAFDNYGEAFEWLSVEPNVAPAN